MDGEGHNLTLHEDVYFCSLEHNASRVNGLQVQNVNTLHPIFLSFLRWLSSRLLFFSIFALQNTLFVLGRVALEQL